MKPGQSHRLLRVGEALRHALSDVLAHGDVRDPALMGMPVTVTEVRISADLRHATVFVMPLGGAGEGDVLAALNRSAGFLGAQVAPRMRLKYFPKLVFRLDETFAAADRIESLLRSPRVVRDLDDGPADADQEG
jgi:ribosome-binding factor A